MTYTFPAPSPPKETSCVRGSLSPVDESSLAVRSASCAERISPEEKSP